MKKLLDATFRIFRTVGNEKYLNLWHPIAWLAGSGLAIYAIIESFWIFIRDIFLVDIPESFLLPVDVIQENFEGIHVGDDYREGDVILPADPNESEEKEPEGGWKFMINGKGVSEKTFSEFWQQYLAGLQKTKA